MKKIKDDPLLSIFKKLPNGELIEEINSIQNIPNFFNYISSDKTPEDSKIGVLENFLLILIKNRYICEYFSSYNNKSIYAYLFDIYLSKNSSEKLKTTALNLINELILILETNKEVYEYLFQRISKIYNKENTTEEKTPENLYSHLTMLNTLLAYKEKIPKPRNYFALSGNGKFVLDLKEKKLNIGYCMTLILNFKIGESKKEDEISTLFNIKFSNNTSLSFLIKAPSFLYIKEGKEEEKLLRGLPINEVVIFVVNLIVEDNSFQVFNFVNGDNNYVPNKYKNNLDLEKDTIESLEFFDNFYGEVTSMTMFLQKDKSQPTINSIKFLPTFKNFADGFHKKKKFIKFLDVISETYASEGKSLNDMISSEYKLLDNLVFIFTPFSYFHSSWEKNNNNLKNEQNKILDDYYGKYNLLIVDKDNSIRNHRYQYYQKKIYLVCDFTNFLPIAEMFLIHPHLLTEKNLELYLQIIENIINYRKRNVEVAKETAFFKILCLFIEKYPNQIFTEKILDAFINIGKDMFKNNLDQLTKLQNLTNTYFKHILLNEKILSKYSKNLQIKFWNQLYLFCQSDSEQLETFIKMNRICLILRFYDKNKYNEICCQNHLNMFTKQFSDKCNIMVPSMDIKLSDIRKIINLIITSQKPNWVLSLFKLLTLDSSPCLTKFIIIAIIKALINQEDKENINDENKKDNKELLDNMVVIPKENSWLNEFMNEMRVNKYETIIINTFIHSLPDVRFVMLKLIYQIYQTLVSLDKKSDFKIFFNMMKKYLLPQKKMFYEKVGDKEVNVLNPTCLKNYYNDVIKFLIFWSLDEKLIEINYDISFDPKKKLDKTSIIKNSDIYEIIFELIKQVNNDAELILNFFEMLSDLSKNPANCNVLLYNYKIFLMLFDLVYECYKLKINDKQKNKNIEKIFLLGKTLISNIYINDLIYKENKFIDDNYTFNEISLIFLWGDKVIFKHNNPKNNLIKNEVFSFIGELFTEILKEFRLKIYPKMNIKSLDNVKKNFIKSYYHQNYLMFMYKLFEFSFEYMLDSLIRQDIINNKPNSSVNISDLMSYNSTFLTSMRLNKAKSKSISLYWSDYQFFEEIYSKISYIWKKDYIYKDYDKGKLKNTNKLKKYEDILENLILNKNKRNLFKNELQFLCSYFGKEKEYDIFGESKDKNSFVEINSNNNILNFSLMRQVQITLLSMLTIILSKESEEEFLKWLKELKLFLIFIIIASTNIIINEKENKDSSEIKFTSYMNLQEQCSFTIYSCLHFLYQLRMISSICKKKIDKTCTTVFLLCFIILKNTYNYRKKNKISKKFTIGYKYNVNDLSGSSVFVLFNDYIKDKTKEKEKENMLITLDKLNTILDQNNYSQNIMKLFNGSNWNDCFYKSSKTLNSVLSEKYFPIIEYKTIVEQRINTINKIEEESNSEDSKWVYSDNEILKLLPLYEKELVHYSNNSLEKNIKKKNLYKTIKKNLFSWRGYWSDRTLFYQENYNNAENNTESNNDSIADKNNVSKIKYKLINHYTKSFMKPLLVPILDIHYYLPDFSGFNPDTIFNSKEKFIVNMDIDKIVKIKEEQKKLDEEKIHLKENYLRKIYIKSNPALADKLLKISNSLDFGKEEEFSFFKEEKDTKNNIEAKKENENKENENKENNNEEEKNYYLSCLVKESHHIKGVCFIDDKNISFKVFLNQKTGNAMSGVNIGFTDKDDDYDKERKTCFGSYFMFHQKDKNLYKIIINYDDIKLILLKRYYYKNSALEIFTVTNKSYYFNFKYEENRDTFINQIISKLKEPKTIINDLKETKDNLNILGYSVQPKRFKNIRKYTRKEIEKLDKDEKKKTTIKLSKKIRDWSRWKINNFSFLMWMNFFANRSYNDISQYPIFPWILSNYDDPLKIEPFYFDSSLYDANSISKINSNITPSDYNLSDSRNLSVISEAYNELENEKKKKKKKGEDDYNYRDLKLPMGMLEINEESKKRKNGFIELYQTLKNDSDEFEGTKPYFYGTNYSNPVYVCNFLMRLFPFTHISIELQGNKIDDPNRLFLSVVKSFNNSISQKTDVRELIPEFFYLPEMFLNINDINLGKIEDNSIVYNVMTPCKNNSYIFIEIMKRIFENNKISSYLNYWVDLIFGYKAKGKDAENAKNVFTEASYQENVNLKNIEEKESFLRGVEFGLIPTQIMSKECQKRAKKRDIIKEKELTEYNWINMDKIKIVAIKHNNSNDKNMKNSDGKNSKLLKANIINNDKIIMLYDNNTIIEDKIGSSSEDISCVYKIKPLDNKINEYYADKINNKIIVFCNFCTTMVVGGFYDGRIEIIYFEDKIEKKRKQINPFSEEEPILCISINKDETFMILGNSIGNIAIYKIDIENDKWHIYKKIYHQMGSISDININNDLNLFCTSSIDGFVNLYTLPLCKLVRSIKLPIKEKDNGQCNYVFLSESSLPSIIMITEDEKQCIIYSYSINGKYLSNCIEDKSLICPLKIKNLNSYEYLVYYANGQVNIRNLPSLSTQIIVKGVFNVKSLCINEDLTAIYALNEDGTQIQAIREK